nr:MAG TPA: hypothetical protein [Caudoviricetes sp.]
MTFIQTLEERRVGEEPMRLRREDAVVGDRGDRGMAKDSCCIIRIKKTCRPTGYDRYFFISCHDEGGGQVRC